MKKIIYGIMLILTSIFFVTTDVLAINLTSKENVLARDPYTTDYERDDDFSTNCHDFAHIIRIGGYIVFLAKLIIPLIIIIKSSINLFSVATSGKAEEEVKKNATKLAYSIGAGILIFFIPTIINTIFGIMSSYNSNLTSDSKICTACVFDPFGDLCKNSAE